MILSQDIRRLYEACDDCLKDSEKTVISLRYGLYGGKEHTQREIAAVLGISRSYVSRIEKRAIEKLREAFGHKDGHGTFSLAIHNLEDAAKSFEQELAWLPNYK